MDQIIDNLHKLSNAHKLKNEIIRAQIKCIMPKCNQIDIDKLKKIFGITDIPDQETAQTELDNLLSSVYEKLQYRINSKVISNIIITNIRDVFEYLVDRKIEFKEKHLIEALAYGNLDTAKMLVQKCGINIQPDSLNKLLEYLVKHYGTLKKNLIPINSDCIKFLFDNGCKCDKDLLLKVIEKYGGFYGSKHLWDTRYKNKFLEFFEEHIHFDDLLNNKDLDEVLSDYKYYKYFYFMFILCLYLHVNNRT